ncbi:hypothetical protein [Calidithermus chliarophilus]|uniref:hypothetical protein n=1 Tax=Calidithermus chliarophilus TaxID=52023 RepID=UPI0012F67A14|nr:hypothetical protein [Calidithermus chliarophilus]
MSSPFASHKRRRWLVPLILLLILLTVGIFSLLRTSALSNSDIREVIGIAALPPEERAESERIAKEIYNEFLLSSRGRPLQVGERMPDVPFRDLENREHSIHGSRTVLFVGRHGCTSCEAAIAKLYGKPVRIAEFVTYGELPSSQPQNVLIADFRANGDSSGPGVGRLPAALAAGGVPAVYLLDETGVIQYVRRSSGFAEETELPAAVERLLGGEKVRTVQVRGLTPNARLDWSRLGAWVDELKPVLGSTGKRSAVIFSHDNCPPCSELFESLKGDLQRLSQNGHGIVLVAVGGKPSGTLGLTVIHDPKGALAKEWNVESWPSTFIFEGDKYVGRLSYRDYTVKTSSNNREILYRQPFTMALEMALKQ